jgi:acyl-CoA synthetase (AMP-forming)/AMP-acid ligase II
MLDQLLHPDLDRPWCDREGGSVRDLVAEAHRIAARLDPRGRRVVLSCKYARSFVPGLLGAWLAGATVELLPNVQPATLDRVDADPEIAHVLHDLAERRARSAKAIYLPALDGPTTPVTPAWPTLAVRLSTSGTTGQPRFVTKTMDQLLHENAAVAAAFSTVRCTLSTVPLSHMYGLTFGALLPLRIGARIVSHDALLPGDLATCLTREAVDFLISTPAHLRAMAAAAMPRGLRVLSSAARLPAELATALADAHAWQITELIGSTETGAIATRPAAHGTWQPLPGVEVGAPDGRLAVASAWTDGERVELDDRIELVAGGFHHVGRASELVKIAGKRAQAHAIEARVRALAGVADAAIFVHETAGKEPRTALAITLDPGAAPVARDAIADAIRHEFDAVFVPRIIRTVAQIPRTDRGKLDPAALRALLGIGLSGDDHIPLRRVDAGRFVADIPADLVFFRGHFAARPILPGAVLVDRVIWAAARTEWPALRALRGLRRLRFHRPVEPGHQLAVNLSPRDDRVMFEVSCAGEPVASGQLLVDRA